MKSDLTKEIERTMDNFLGNATDEEFWATLEEAGWGVFSEVDVPILSYHSNAARYSVTAKQMLSPASMVVGGLCYTQSALVAGGLTIVLDKTEIEIAANNNELALAA